MIYLDNAATSFPKPKCVLHAVSDYMKNVGVNYGRGGYKSATKTIGMLFDIREKTAEFIGADNPERIVFTKNATEALNIAITGTVKSRDKVVVSPYEHNSVIRPLMQKGCSIVQLPLKKDGGCDAEKLSEHSDAALAVINHSSNVSGAVSDIYRAAEICRKNDIPLLIDASQSAGVLPLDVKRLSCMVAFAGHKGMLGPQGTGVLYIPEDYEVRPLMTGGTGSMSQLLTQPDIMPDKFESGTLNMPALCGLSAACTFVKNHFDEIYTYENALTLRLIEGLCNIKGINVICPENKLRTSAVSFFSDTVDTNEFGRRLDGAYDVAVRCGLHCAPLAHKAYGTYDVGTVRASAGFFTRKSDIDYFVSAVNKIQKGL